MEGKMDENGGCFSKRGVGSLFDAPGKRYSYIYSNLGFQNRKQQSRQTSTAFRMRKAGSESLMRFCSQSGLICQVGEKRDEWNSIDGAAKALRGLAEGTKEKNMKNTVSSSYSRLKSESQDESSCFFQQSNLMSTPDY